MPVPPEIRCDDAMARCEALLGEAAKASPMRLHAVEANNGRGVSIAPLVQMELHYVSSPSPEGS